MLSLRRSRGHGDGPLSEISPLDGKEPSLIRTARLTWTVPTSLLVDLCPREGCSHSLSMFKDKAGIDGTGAGSSDIIRVKFITQEGLLWVPKTRRSRCSGSLVPTLWDSAPRGHTCGVCTAGVLTSGTSDGDV